ncbi:MerR family transcriptional regulator [Pelagibius marinus]|uniref:MerR family transcriptional regulator n=1 Tax=Pelagibius marinus TaxID=2762760 RepID=UPI001872E682|nr:MerR family transcriptional regulator [Pelagibius marinus]
MPASRPAGKSAAAFRTISEVSDELDVPQHVLRFWEGKFSQVRPLKRGGGRRYYRPEDISLLRRIRDLLYSEGYTIKGVQRLLREGRGKDGGEEPAAAPVATGSGDRTKEIQAAIDELSELRDMLKAAGKGAS